MYKCLGKYPMENGCDTEPDSLYQCGDCCECPRFGCELSGEYCLDCPEDCIYSE
jgi:hypothetical protein